MNYRIITKDHQAQLLASHKATQNSNPTSGALVQMELELQCGVITIALRSLYVVFYYCTHALT